MAALATVFFAFLFVDERALNRIEDQLDVAVAQVPLRQRVISLAVAEEVRVDPIVHAIDRACIGRCFSYANYEPCTAAFRVRCSRNNPIVVDNYADSYAIQTGGYIVKPRDFPLYGVVLRPGTQSGFTLRLLEPGERISPTHIRFAPGLFE